VARLTLHLRGRGIGREHRRGHPATDERGREAAQQRPSRDPRSITGEPTRERVEPIVDHAHTPD
jgi:hypothetical protein